MFGSPKRGRPEGARDGGGPIPAAFFRFLFPETEHRFHLLCHCLFSLSDNTRKPYLYYVDSQLPKPGRTPGSRFAPCGRASGLGPTRAAWQVRTRPGRPWSVRVRRGRSGLVGAAGMDPGTPGYGPEAATGSPGARMPAPSPTRSPDQPRRSGGCRQHPTACPRQTTPTAPRCTGVGIIPPRGPRPQEGPGPVGGIRSRTGPKGLRPPVRGGSLPRTAPTAERTRAHEGHRADIPGSRDGYRCFAGARGFLCLGSPPYPRPTRTSPSLPIGRAPLPRPEGVSRDGCDGDWWCVLRFSESDFWILGPRDP